MGLLSTLINKHKIARAEKEAFSGHKTYSFEVKLAIGSQNEKVEIWLPLPINTPYQKTLDLNLSPSPDKIYQDKTFKVAYWQLPAKSTHQVVARCKVRVSPRRRESFDGNLDSYEKNEQFKNYTQNDQYFSFASQRVKNLAEKIKGGSEAVSEISSRFYEYVRDNLNYGQPIEGLYSSTEALDKDVVDCGGYDSLLGALLRCVGIPARLVSGFLSYPGEHMHAWVEFLTPEGIWIPADPANEHLRLKNRDFKPGGFAKVGNDRIVTSLGTGFMLNGRRFPLLQMPVTSSKNNLKRSIKINEI